MPGIEDYAAPSHPAASYAPADPLASQSGHRVFSELPAARRPPIPSPAPPDTTAEQKLREACDVLGLVGGVVTELLDPSIYASEVAPNAESANIRDAAQQVLERAHFVRERVQVLAQVVHAQIGRL